MAESTPRSRPPRSGAPSARGKDARSKDSRSKDSRGKDSRGKDSRGKDSGGRDSRGRDPRSKDGRGADRASSPREPRTGDRPRGPRVPEGVTGQELDRRVLAELRTLPEALAEQVAKLLVATSMALAEDDPDVALQYAAEAKRKAGRVSVVREAVGIAAYSAGDYATALAELRAVRRMTGDASAIPMMADCERGLGRPRKALELLAEMPADSVDDASRIEALIVEAGARRDLGEADMAVVLLQVPALNARRTEPWLARLRYAYADALADVGRMDDARTWFIRAADVDPEALTDAADRVAEIDGVVFGDEELDDAVEEALGDADVAGDAPTA